MALLQPKEIAQPQNQLTLQGVASLARHTELAIHSAEVGVSDCMVGPQPGGAAVALGGARGIALREKRGAEVVVRFSEIGLEPDRDRKSTRLNSSHLVISYAVFCLKKKKSPTFYRFASGRSRSPGRDCCQTLPPSQ